ncbi:reticulocyte-binding protein 2 homolog a [Plakobranchus ocellatus]|uniref:Reticulocyte-binding protein 2 homolog a n=1 Tax=Plakobranchus ocellatus TaxID=259542 RepID=A0AAV4AQ07_9GAST|nr:reticulocyte-binding protein 2 homolog a [Plakobranchus ocellatus]
MEDEVDDRYAGIDIDSLLNQNETRRNISYGRKKALYEAPEFLQRLNGEETLMEGQALCLECKVGGFPVPTLRWYKDDEEIVEHPRIKVESDGRGGYTLRIDNVMRGDEAAYRCRAENVEGACSSIFFLSVRAKPKNSKKDSQKSQNRRTVSFPPMFSTIVEKVEEEEKQGKEFEMLPPSPLTDSYYALTLKSRATWPAFLGDWAFKNGAQTYEKRRRNRRGSDGEPTPNGDIQEPQSPSEGRRNARRSLTRSDLTARVEAKKQRLDEERKKKEEEEKEMAKKKAVEEKEALRKMESKLIMEREERRRKRAELENESAQKEEAMRKRREARAERLKKEREEEEARLLKEQEEEEKRIRLENERRKAERKKQMREELLLEEKLEKEEEERKALEKRRQKEEEKKKEEQERASEKKKEEEKKTLERKRQEEEKMKEEEERALEKKRLEDEKRKEEEKRALEKKSQEEEKKKKDEERVLEKKRQEEEKRKEEEKRILEKKRQEEMTRKEEEEEHKRKHINETRKTGEEKMKKLPIAYLKNQTEELKERSNPLETKHIGEKERQQDHQRKDNRASKNNSSINVKQDKKSQPKALKMFQDKAEVKTTALVPDKPKSKVLNRFEQKFEPKPTKPSEKTGKMKIPTGLNDVNQAKAVHPKTQGHHDMAKDRNLSDETKTHTDYIPEKPAPSKIFGQNRDAMKASNATENFSMENNMKKEAIHKNQDGASSKHASSNLEKRTQIHPKEKEPDWTQELSLKDAQKKVEEKIKESKEKQDAKKKAYSSGASSVQTPKREENQEKDKNKQKLVRNDLVQKQPAKGETKEESIKEDLYSKQDAQRELLQRKKGEDEQRKREQKEKEEQEKMRIQFRKEQMRKEQLKRQHEEEIQRRQQKQKEDEKKRLEEKLSSNTRAQENQDDEFQVKVHKRDYSFSDLRKSLETTLTKCQSSIIDVEEHKYWDDILEKHNYSVGDIKKTFDTLSSGSATLDRPKRLRSRRNSIEELDIIQMKRSSSITDLRESFTKSLEGPKSKKKASDTKTVKKDGEILKRSANINETRQQLLKNVQKQLEPLTGGISRKEADITIRNLKSKTDDSALSLPSQVSLSSNEIQSQPSRSSTATTLGLNNLSIDVKSKRASFHEILSHQTEPTPPLRIASSKGKDLSKRKSYHGHDAYGSREIPVYQKVAGWTDEIGKSPDLSPQNSSSTFPDKGLKKKDTLLPKEEASKTTVSFSKSGKPSVLDKLNTGVRPFVFNSTRTIARKSTGSISSNDLTTSDDDDDVFDDDLTFGKENGISLDKPCAVTKTPLFYFDEEGDITVRRFEEDSENDFAPPEESRINSLKTSPYIDADINMLEGERCARAEKGLANTQQGETNKMQVTDKDTLKLGEMAEGETTPPITVELWDSNENSTASDVQEFRTTSPDTYSSDCVDLPLYFREEREPTPFAPPEVSGQCHQSRPIQRVGNNSSESKFEVDRRMYLEIPVQQMNLRSEKYLSPSLNVKTINNKVGEPNQREGFQREGTPYFTDRKLQPEKPFNNISYQVTKHQITPKDNIRDKKIISPSSKDRTSQCNSSISKNDIDSPQNIIVSNAPISVQNEGIKLTKSNVFHAAESNVSICSDLKKNEQFQSNPGGKDYPKDGSLNLLKSRDIDKSFNVTQTSKGNIEIHSKITLLNEDHDMKAFHLLPGIKIAKDTLKKADSREPEGQTQIISSRPPIATNITYPQKSRTYHAPNKPPDASLDSAESYMPSLSTRESFAGTDEPVVTEPSQSEPTSAARTGIDLFAQGLTVFMSVIEWIALPPLPSPTASSVQPRHSQSSLLDQAESPPPQDTGGESTEKCKIVKRKKLRSRRLRTKASNIRSDDTSSLGLNERRLQCSPFGPYTLQAVFFIFLLTFLCLYLRVPVEKYVCYVLACFYTFCVLRHLGLLT